MDIGCAGGVNKYFYGVFEDKLQIIGIDAIVYAIKKLVKENTNPKARYYANFITSEEYQDEAYNHIMGRTSANKSHLIISEKFKNKKKARKPDSSDERDAKEDEVDIDDVIQKNLYELVPISAINSFLHPYNLYIIDLSINRYRADDLPGRFLYTLPAQSLKGRATWTNLIFLKDTVRFELNRTKKKTKLSVQKVIKLAMLMELFDKSSWAAELINHHNVELRELGVDTDLALDKLAMALTYEENIYGFQNQSNSKTYYQQYLDYFYSEPERFYREKSK